MQAGKTLQDFTNNYNAIIKSKWRLLEEVDCLPNDREIKTDIAQKIYQVFERARQELWRESKEMADVIFLYTQERDNQVELLAGSASKTPFVIATWQLIHSHLQPEAVKEVWKVSSYDSESSFKDVLKKIAQTILDDANVDTIVQIWDNLPASVKKKPDNLVCPCCRSRGTCYVCDYDDKYIVRCGECDYEGPKRIAQYEAVDAYVEHFNRSFLRARKIERFDLLANQQVDTIIKALDKISSLKRNKACYCTPESNEKLKKTILDAISAHFEEEKVTKK